MKVRMTEPMIEPNLLLTRADAFEFLKSTKSNSIDCLITDPPYESLEKHRKRGTTTRLKNSNMSSNEWFDVIPNSRFPELFAEFYRVLTKNSHLYLFCDSETMFIAKPILEQVGFKFWKPLIWDKVYMGMGYHYRAQYEVILFCEKGKRKLNNLGITDVLSHRRIARKYPAQKPVSLIKTLIEQSTNDDEIVCDPFVGSGATAIAALQLGRQFVGCDVASNAIATSFDNLDAAGFSMSGHRIS